MKLNEEQAIAWWMDHLAGTLDKEKKILLEAYLNENPTLSEELNETASLWDQMGDLKVPEPSKAMDHRFEGMLTGYRTAASGGFRWSLLTRWAQANWQVGFASLVIGMVIGIFLVSRPNQEVLALTSEVQDMRKMLMLTLMEKPQAQDRIKAVNMTSDMPGADQKVIGALTSTLNHDPSINVRLAALEALLAYSNQPNVRESLVSSIGMQQSPLMQVALADAMIALQEKSAAEEFSKVLNSPGLNESIKPKLESTIQTLKEI